MTDNEPKYRAPNGIAETKPEGRRCFLHIPKSAGATVRIELAEHFGADAISPVAFDRSVFGGFDRFDELAPHVRAQIAVSSDELPRRSDARFVIGHFCLPSLRELAPDHHIATILREPRARVLSIYAYWRMFSPASRALWSPYDVADLAGEPLEDFLNGPAAAAQTDNVICRLLLGPDPRLPRDGFLEVRDAALVRDVATDAIRALDGLGGVAVLEAGPADWQLLSDTLGAPVGLRRLNVTGENGSDRPVRAAPGPLFTATAVDRLAERTTADSVVYRHALVHHAGWSEDDAARLTESAFIAQVERTVDLVGRHAFRADLERRRRERQPVTGSP